MAKTLYEAAKCRDAAARALTKSVFGDLLLGSLEELQEAISKLLGSSQPYGTSPLQAENDLQVLNGLTLREIIAAAFPNVNKLSCRRYREAVKLCLHRHCEEVPFSDDPISYALKVEKVRSLQ